jgi:hypothetical protein
MLFVGLGPYPSQPFEAGWRLAEADPACPQTPLESPAGVL